MATNYPLIPGTLASDCYPASPQTLYNEMFAKGVCQLASGAIVGVYPSQTAPGIGDRDKLWIKLDASDRALGAYMYAGGLWVWKHPCPAGGFERRLFVGSTADLATYDGGTNTAVSDVTGPMWEVDTNFAARFPVGVGTTANGTVINVTNTGGEDEHTLTVDEMPAHTHTASSVWLNTWPAGTNELGGGVDATAGAVTNANTGGDDPHNNLPPYYGCYIIKRTARIFWVG